MTSTSKFTLKNLTLSLHPNHPILKNISLKVAPGRITTLIGPSGSGKSTLLRCLNRLWEPPANSVFLEDIDITTMDVLSLRRRVGMLFQTAALFQGTIADNVCYGPRLHGETLSTARRDELMEMVSLEPSLLQKPADELSGGQAQRVALARVLANNPEVLLLDEPTSALDPAATQRVEETILRLRDTLELTVVWVSHSIEQVQRVADDLVLLVEGTIAETGSPDHLLSGSHRHLVDDFAEGKL